MLSIFLPLYLLQFDFHNKLQQCQEQAKTAYKDYFGGLAVDRTLFEGEFYKSEKYIRFLQEKENFTPKLRGSISLPPSSRNWQLRFLTSENSQSFEDFLISAIGSCTHNYYYTKLLVSPYFQFPPCFIRCYCGVLHFIDICWLGMDFCSPSPRQGLIFFLFAIPLVFFLFI